jgi:hypothetical protein
VFPVSSKTADYVGDRKYVIPPSTEAEGGILPFIFPGLSGGKKSPQWMDSMGFGCFYKYLSDGADDLIEFLSAWETGFGLIRVRVNLIF